MLKKKEITSIEINYDKGESKKITNACVIIELKKKDSQGNSDFNIEFINADERQTANLILGMYGFLEKSVNLEEIKKIYGLYN